MGKEKNTPFIRIIGYTQLTLKTYVSEVFQVD